MLTIMTLSMLLIVPSNKVMAQVSATVNVYAWVDKPQYEVGETGTLYITVRNDRTDSIEIRNVTIRFPWFAYVQDHWEGNETIKGTPVDTISSEGGHYYREVKFTVPNDGRATALSAVGWSEIMIDVDASEGKADDFPADLLVMSPTVNMAR